MEIQKNKTNVEFLELINKMKNIKKIKSESKNDDSFKMNIEVSSYFELNQKITALLKTSINMLQDDASANGIYVMLLLEIALQLLPSDEMELLDEVFNIKL